MKCHSSRLHWRWIALAVLVIAISVPVSAVAAEVRLMTIDTLNAQLDDPNTVVLDVRTGRDWDSSGSLIQGARRVSPRGAATWGPTLDKSKTFVFYCA